MKPFLKNLVRFAAIQLCVGMALLVFAWDNLDPQIDYDASLIDKHALLENQPEPRVILIGGSNVAFGFNSRVLKERLHVNPINMATHAALGRRWMLEDVADQLRPNDIVVVSMEYEAFGTFRGDFPNILRAIRFHPESVSAMTWDQGKHFLDNGFRITGFMARRGLRRMRNFDFSPTKPINHAYTRWMFNEFGDNIGAYDPTPVPKRIQKPNRFRQITPATIEAAINDLNEFAEECRRRGAKVYFTYPPLVEDHFNAAREQIAELDGIMHERLDFPILTSPEEMAVPIEWIFDAKEHLTPEGATWRSELIAERLLKENEMVVTESGEESQGDAGVRREHGGL